MNPLLSAAIAASGLAALHSVRKGARPRRFFILKPLTTTLIFAAAWWAPASSARSWMLGGLAFSLVGDVGLLFPGDGAFLGGLGSFLVAHLAFIAAFGTGLHGGPPPLWTAALGAYAAWLLRRLWARAGALRIPVALYGLVLLTMALAAARAHHVHGTAASAWGLAGALTFVVSDSLLAADRFLRPHSRAQLAILLTYWAALLGLVQSLFG